MIRSGLDSQIVAADISRYASNVTRWKNDVLDFTKVEDPGPAEPSTPALTMAESMRQSQISLGAAVAQAEVDLRDLINFEVYNLFGTVTVIVPEGIEVIVRGGGLFASQKIESPGAIIDRRRAEAHDRRRDTLLFAPPFTADQDKLQSSRRIGLTKLVHWLEEQPGRTWQDRWVASGAGRASPTRQSTAASTVALPTAARLVLTPPR